MQNILLKRLTALKQFLKESAGQMRQYMVLWDYQDKGCTRYRLRTNGDTCKECTSLDGKIFVISEAESGKNFIPLHPNCDCSAEVLDEAGNAVFVIYKDNADETEDENSTDAFDCLATSLKQMFLGNFAEGSNLLGTLGQVALGLLGLDLPMDIRDLLYDITNFKLTPEHAFQTIMDVFALLPGVGAAKYTDEIGDTLKLTAKHGDDVGEIRNTIKIFDKEIVLPKPEDIEGSAWKDITPPEMKRNTSSRVYKKDGLTIRLDKGISDASGYKSKDHYHILNPYATGKRDFYLDKAGNPIPKNSKSSHILP